MDREAIGHGRDNPALQDPDMAGGAREDRVRGISSDSEGAAPVVWWSDSEAHELPPMGWHTRSLHHHHEIAGIQDRVKSAYLKVYLIRIYTEPSQMTGL